MANSRPLPEIWPGYETVEKIGKGGYGSVYKVRKADKSGSYYSAVKKITIPAGEDEYYALRESGYEDNEITTIFQSRLEKIEAEFRLMEKYKGDSHIVSYLEHMVIDRSFENYDGADILIRMELLQSLGSRYARFSEKEVVHLGTDICSALELIQKDGIVHRDIKPSNILYNDRLAYYKLADFGIAKAIDHATKGTMIGTVDYIAPEVYHKEAYGFQADQYSLGLVLYWALNQRKLPFVPLDHIPTDDEIQAARQKRMNGEPFPAPLYGCSELHAIVCKACAYDPADRYEDITALKRALLLCSADETPFGATAAAGPASPGSLRESGSAVSEASGIPAFADDDEVSGTIGRPGGSIHTPPADKPPVESKASPDEVLPEAPEDETMGRFGKRPRVKPPETAGIPEPQEKESREEGLQIPEPDTVPEEEPAEPPERKVLTAAEREAVLRPYIQRFVKDSVNNFVGCCTGYDHHPRMINTCLKKLHVSDIKEGQVLGCLLPVTPYYQKFLTYVFTNEGIYSNAGTLPRLLYKDVDQTKVYLLPSGAQGVKVLLASGKIQVYQLSMGNIQLIDADLFERMLHDLAGIQQ